MIASSEDAAKRIKSQLSVLQRSEISNPPAHGARLVRGNSMAFFLYRDADGCVADVVDFERPGAICGMGQRHQDDGPPHYFHAERAVQAADG